MSTLFRRATVVTAVEEFVGDVLAVDGRTAAIGSDLLTHLDVTPDTVVDCEGMLLLPGGVDPHTHLAYDLGVTATSDDYATGTIGAAFGGTTTIVNFTRQDPGASLASVLQQVADDAEAVASIDFGQHLVLTHVDADVLGELHDVLEDGVSSVKLFMAYPGDLMVDDAAMLRVMRVTAEHGAMTCVHAENGLVVDEFVREALGRGQTNPAWHGRTRPVLAEAEATHRAIVLAEIAGAAVYFVHVSCGAALREISTARDAGAPVYAETCPQYLVLDDSAYDDETFEAAKYVFTPPLRSTDDQRALWRGLATRDLQVVATDHCPFDLHGQKTLGADDFSLIPNGAPGIEHRLQLLYGLGVRTGRLTLPELVAATATNPARIFGLAPAKGSITVGGDADYVLLDPTGTTTVSAATHHMSVDHSLFEGWELPGRIEAVYLRGRPVVRAGEYVGEAGTGRFVARGRWARP